MSTNLPDNRIKKVKLPNNSEYEIIPERLQKNGFEIAPPENVDADSTIALTSNLPTKVSDLTNDRFVRYDTNTQGLNTTQKSNARTNIGLGTAATKNTGTSSGDVPVLDSNGKLDTAVLPAIAISDTFVVDTEVAMLALTAQVGDVCVRSDLNKSFILKEDGASTLSHWQELLAPGAVVSVNNKTGAVTLTASDVGALPDNYTPAIKALNTTNITSQETSSNEAIGGTGTINLHKIAKTGKYSDLLNPPDLSSLHTHANKTVLDEVDQATIDNIVYNAGTLSTVAGSSTSGSVLSVRWYNSGIDGITTPYDGMKIMIKVPLAGVSTGGVILSINGNTDSEYHPVAYNVSTVLTTHFPVNSYKVFVYDANATMTCYKTSGTSSSVTGVWKGESNYNADTTMAYGSLAYYLRPYTSQALYRYKLCMLDKDNKLVPVTTDNVIGSYGSSTSYSVGQIVYYSGKIYKCIQAGKGKTPSSQTAYWEVINPTATDKAFRPDKIYWYNTTTTIAANAVVGGNTLMYVGYNATNMVISNFNGDIAAYRLVYLCGTYNKETGLFTLNGGGSAGTNYYTVAPTNTSNINLTDYFISGKDYILVGGTYSSANYLHLSGTNTMYHFDGTNLVPYDTYNDNRIENLIPTVDYPVTDVKVNNSSVVSNKVANIVTNTAYNASSNKIATMSDLPAVNNNTITLTQGGVTKGSFTLNQSGDSTIALDDSKNLYIDLTGNSGTLTNEQYNTLLDGAYIRKATTTSLGTTYEIFLPISCSSVSMLEYVRYSSDLTGRLDGTARMIYVLTATKEWESTTVDLITYNSIKSTGATSGQVLTANGSGGCSWETASGADDYNDLENIPIINLEEAPGFFYNNETFVSGDKVYFNTSKTSEMASFLENLTYSISDGEGVKIEPLAYGQDKFAIYAYDLTAIDLGYILMLGDHDGSSSRMNIIYGTQAGNIESISWSQGWNNLAADGSFTTLLRNTETITIGSAEGWNGTLIATNGSWATYDDGKYYKAPDTQDLGGTIYQSVDGALKKLLVDGDVGEVLDGGTISSSVILQGSASYTLPQNVIDTICNNLDKIYLVHIHGSYNSLKFNFYFRPNVVQTSSSVDDLGIDLVSVGSTTLAYFDQLFYSPNGLTRTMYYKSVGAKDFLTAHQRIKNLNTAVSEAQSYEADESITGSGTIYLHKIAKTGTYSDLIGKPTIPANDSDLTNNRYVRYDINNQGLNDTQKQNARTNIGAGTSNLSLGTSHTTAAYGDHNHSGVYQPVDADLTAIAGLTGTSGLLKKTAANTWALDTTAYTTNTGTVTSVSAGTGLSISGTASVTPTVNIASGYKLPTTDEYNGLAELAEGKTKTYIIDAQSDITGTKGTNDEYTDVTAITGVTLTDLCLGDIILIKALNVPDYWVSQISPSVSLNKMETTKVTVPTSVNGLSGGTITSSTTISGDMISNYVKIASIGHETTSTYNKHLTLSSTNYVRYRTTAELKSDLGVPTKTSDITNDSGYLTSSTGVTSVNGSSGAITGIATTSDLSDYIPKSIFTTEGDIIYASGSGNPIRLPIGTEGQVLKVAQGGEDLVWSNDQQGVVSVGAGTGLSISGTASYNPTVNIASGYKLPTTTEWGNKADTSALASYLPLSGGQMTGCINTAYNAPGINLRTGHGSYNGVISYRTSGNEAMCFDVQNAVTSFMFRTKNSASDTSGGWDTVTPSLQIKNQQVAINKLIANGTSLNYNLDINGTTNATSYTVAGGGTMTYDSTNECIKFTF